MMSDDLLKNKTAVDLKLAADLLHCEIRGPRVCMEFNNDGKETKVYFDDWEDEASENAVILFAKYLDRVKVIREQGV